MAFDADGFVRDVRSAVLAADPLDAVREVVASAVVDGTVIDAALGRQIKSEHDLLFGSDDLTIQRIIWPAGVATRPHDHRMWGVAGVYAGAEVNHLYQRTPNGLRECATRTVAKQDVLVLDANAIHSVENPSRNWTAGLHVYGGDIVHAERSAWAPDGREVPFADDVAAYRAMFGPMRELADEHNNAIDDEARYLAFTALTAAIERERRYPTPHEARDIIAAAWNLET
jgi:predicted metal-dependent enzyme (double-stranded beta helix superfamily)